MNVTEELYTDNLCKQNQHLNDHTITKSDFSYSNHTDLKTKYKPRKTPTEQQNNPIHISRHQQIPCKYNSNKSKPHYVSQ
jgi:hypothetical protein